MRCSSSCRYVQNDRYEEAYDTLLEIRDDPDLIAQEMQDIRQAIAFEKKQTNSTWTRYKLLWTDKSVRRRIRKFYWPCSCSMPDFASPRGCYQYWTTTYRKQLPRNILYH